MARWRDRTAWRRWGAALLIAALASSLLAAPAAADNPVQQPVLDLGQRLIVTPYVQLPATAFGQPRLNSMKTVGNRTVVVEEVDGVIWEIIEGPTGPEPAVFFDVKTAIGSATDRTFDTTRPTTNGLRSVAFHPSFATTGLFYTAHYESRPTPQNPESYLFDPPEPMPYDSVVVEWQYDHTTDTVDPQTYRQVLRLGLRTQNHNLKQIFFDPFAMSGDASYGLLHIGVGDGARSVDPDSTGQANDPFGKFLLIDPLVDGANPYRVPTTNPFVGDPSMPDEVWSLGHRNPHHLTWAADSTGAIHVIEAEPGHDNVEEINLMTAGSNYGWAEREGTFVKLPSGGIVNGVAPLPVDEALNGYTFPAAQVGHDGVPGESSQNQFIAGGYVADNGSELDGQYLFSWAGIPGTMFHVAVDELATAVTELDPADPARDEPTELTQAQVGVMDVLFDHDADATTPLVHRDHLLDVFDDAPSYDGTGRADVRLGQGPGGEIYVMTKRNGWIYLVVNSDPTAPTHPDPVDPPDPDPANLLLLSSTNSGMVASQSFADEDIVAYDPADDTWSIYFDGSGAGIAAADINGFHVVDPAAAQPTIWMTFQHAVAVPGLGTVDDSDVVAYDGAAGSFAMVLDGSTVGLTANGEDVDSIAATAAGELVLSTNGTASVIGTGGSLSAADEDLFVQRADGSFELWFDGSDIGHTSDTWGAWIDPSTGDLSGAGYPSFSFGGASGDGDDVYTIVGSFGPNTSGAATVVFDGDVDGFANEQIDGVARITDGSPTGVPPSAVDDAPPSTSQPGDPLHTAVDTALAHDVMSNDALGQPEAVVTTFGGRDLGGPSPDTPAGTTRTFGTGGSVVVQPDGSLAFTPSSGFEGEFTFDYVLANESGTSTATISVQVGPRPTPDQVFHVSFSGSGSVGGVSFADEDVLTLDPATGAWSRLFDGSANGIGGDVNALHIVNPESATPLLWMSSQVALNVPGLGSVDDSDIFSFDTSTGLFGLVLDGSTAGFTQNGEDIDAIGTTSDDRLVVSTVGSANLPGPNGSFTARDEDLVVQRPDSTWELFFDGSASGFTNDFSALTVGADSSELYGASLFGFTILGIAGGPVDVFATTGGAASIALDGDAFGAGGEQLDALHLTGAAEPPPDVPPVPQADSADTFTDTPVSSPNLLANDDRGRPLASIVSFGGGSLGGMSTDHAAGATVSAAPGDLTVAADGSFTFSPLAGFEGVVTFDYVLQNSEGAGSTTVTITVVAPPEPSDDVLYLSSASGGSVGGVSFADEDIVALDLTTMAWSLVFDGSSAGIAGADINGFHIVDPAAPAPVIWMTSQVPVTVPGLGSTDDSDIVAYDTATGQFSLVLDGSTVGLDVSAEDIDGISVLADGRLAVSTIASATVPAAGGATLSARDEDVMALNPDGTWELHFDGSDVGFTGDLWSLSIDPISGELTGGGLDGFTIGGVTGDQDDLFTFAGSFGPTTTGSAVLEFVGDVDGFTTEQIDGTQLVSAPQN